MVPRDIESGWCIHAQDDMISARSGRPRSLTQAHPVKQALEAWFGTQDIPLRVHE